MIEKKHGEQPDEMDRLLLVSHQPDALRAAAGFATAFTSALAKVKVRDGLLIAQLDELLDAYQTLLADVPFLPEYPVVLCLTGSPRLVAAVVINLASVTNARFAQIRPRAAVGGLRVCAYAKDGRVTVNVDREFGEAGIAKLTKTGWYAERAEGEGISPALLEAESILEAMSAKEPTPFVVPKASSGSSGKTTRPTSQPTQATSRSPKLPSRR